MAHEQYEQHDQRDCVWVSHDGVWMTILYASSALSSCPSTTVLQSPQYLAYNCPIRV